MQLTIVKAFLEKSLNLVFGTELKLWLCYLSVSQFLSHRLGRLTYITGLLFKAISRKRCKIRGKSLLIINRKSHMGFALVPNSVTFNDLERRNRPNGCVISPNSVALWADCVKVVEDARILSAVQM